MTDRRQPEEPVVNVELPASLFNYVYQRLVTLGIPDGQDAARMVALHGSSLHAFETAGKKANEQDTGGYQSNVEV